MTTKKKTIVVCEANNVYLRNKLYNNQYYEHMNTIVTYYKSLAFFQKEEVIAH